MKIKNISKKIIGIGELVLLPHEAGVVPEAYSKSIVLDIYRSNGLIEVLVESEDNKAEGDDGLPEEADIASGEATETLRKARLASLKGISDQDLGKLANELGINPADCKDMADMLKKVKDALKK